MSHISFHEWWNKCQVKTLQLEETKSPVFHEPEVFPSLRAVAHDQDGVVYEPWVAVGHVVQTWKMQKVKNIPRMSQLQCQHPSADLSLHLILTLTSSVQMKRWQHGVYGHRDRSHWPHHSLQSLLVSSWEDVEIGAVAGLSLYRVPTFPVLHIEKMRITKPYYVSLLNHTDSYHATFLFLLKCIQWKLCILSCSSSSR